MSKEAPSVFDLIEKVEYALPIRKVLPVEDWQKTLVDVGELLIPCVYGWKELAKYKLSEDVKNKTVFLRSSVQSALPRIDSEFEAELYYATGKHKQLGTPAIVVSTKDRIESAGFTAKRCTPTPEEIAERKRRSAERKAKTKKVEEPEKTETEAPSETPSGLK